MTAQSNRHMQIKKLISYLEKIKNLFTDIFLLNTRSSLLQLIRVNIKSCFPVSLLHRSSCNNFSQRDGLPTTIGSKDLHLQKQVSSDNGNYILNRTKLNQDQCNERLEGTHSHILKSGHCNCPCNLKITPIFSFFHIK